MILWFLHDLNHQPVVVCAATTVVNCWWLCSSSGSSSSMLDLGMGVAVHAPVGASCGVLISKVECFKLQLIW